MGGVPSFTGRRPGIDPSERGLEEQAAPAGFRTGLAGRPRTLWGEVDITPRPPLRECRAAGVSRAAGEWAVTAALDGARRPVAAAARRDCSVAARRDCSAARAAAGRAGSRRARSCGQAHGRHRRCVGASPAWPAPIAQVTGIGTRMNRKFSGELLPATPLYAVLAGRSRKCQALDSAGRAALPRLLVTRVTRCGQCV